MKTIKILSLLFVVLLVSSCKQNDWLDWKAQNELWLVQNAQRDSIQTSPTGLQYKCIYAGYDKSARPAINLMRLIPIWATSVISYQVFARG